MIPQLRNDFNQFVKFLQIKGCLADDTQRLLNATLHKLLSLLLRPDYNRRRAAPSHDTLNLRVMCVTDDNDLEALRALLLHNLMNLLHIRAGCINQLQPLFFDLFVDALRNPM